MKNYYALEKIARGFSNHRRIEILDLIERNPSISVLEVSRGLRVNMKTISEHMRRLTIAGLIYKKSDGVSIRHTLSRLGKSTLMFLRTLDNA